ACCRAEVYPARGGDISLLISGRSGGSIRELALVADERAVARPHQPIGAGGAEKLARILPCLWPQPVAAGDLDPGAPRVDGAQQRLEACAVDAGLRIGAAEMVDHDLDAAGLQRGQDFRQIFAFDMRMNVPAEVGEAAKQRAIVECGD